MTGRIAPPAPDFRAGSGDCALPRPGVSVGTARAVRPGQGVSAVRTVHRRALTGPHAATPGPGAPKPGAALPAASRPFAPAPALDLHGALRPAAHRGTGAIRPAAPHDTGAVRPAAHRAAVRSGAGLGGAVVPGQAAPRSFPLGTVRSLTRRGRLVHLYGRQHIDLLRVAGALCRR
jgi:hypothetical protein